MPVEEQQSSPTGRDRRDRVLAAAQQLFLDKGFSCTTVDTIVRAARVSKTDFYGLFDNREAVFLEVAKRLTAPADQQFQLIEGPPFERLAEAALRLCPAQLARQPIGIFRAAITATRLSPALAREVYLSRVGAAKAIGRYLDELAAQGLASFDDGHLTAIRFGALATDGLRHLAGRPLPDLAIRNQNARQVADVLLHGYATAGLRQNAFQKCSEAGDALANWAPPIRGPLTGPVTRLPESRWEAVLDEAWAAFRDRGFEEVSMDAVGRATGLPKNTIYRRYKSKAGLFTAACEKVIDTVFREPPKAAWSTDCVRDNLITVAQGLQSAFCTPDMLELNRLVIVHAAYDPVRSSGIYEHLVRRVEAMLSPMVQALREAGLLRDSISGSASWHFFILATFNTRFLFIPPASDEERLRLSCEAVDLFLFGLDRIASS